MPRSQAMRFCLLDEIVDLEPGVNITARKRLRADEDYLQDHFPKFPVMPGVLMLEAMFQASSWLVRKTDNFENPIVLMKEARSVKYADFVAPGQVLTVFAQIVKQDGPNTTLKVQGTLGDGVAVSGRLVLERFKLAERWPSRRDVDPYSRKQQQAEFARLWRPSQALETAR